MDTENEHIEPQESKDKEKTKQSFFKALINGKIISEKLILKNFGYILFITLLCSFYIANRFHAEKITRETSKILKENIDLRARSLSTSARLMSSSRQSEVYRLVREHGLELEELKVPPYKIIIDK